MEASASAATDARMAALQGKAGFARDCLLYSASICLNRPGRCKTLAEFAKTVREKRDSGAALVRLEAAKC